MMILAEVRRLFRAALITPSPISAVADPKIVFQVLAALHLTNHSEVLHHGDQLARVFLGRTFSTVLGDFSISEFGERIPLLRITQLDERGQKFRVQEKIK